MSKKFKLPSFATDMWRSVEIFYHDAAGIVCVFTYPTCDNTKFQTVAAKAREYDDYRISARLVRGKKVFQYYEDAETKTLTEVK